MCYCKYIQGKNGRKSTANKVPNANLISRAEPSTFAFTGDPNGSSVPSQSACPRTPNADHVAASSATGESLASGSSRITDRFARWRKRTNSTTCTTTYETSVRSGSVDSTVTSPPIAPRRLSAARRKSGDQQLQVASRQFLSVAQHSPRDLLAFDEADVYCGENRSSVVPLEIEPPSHSTANLHFSYTRADENMQLSQSADETQRSLLMRHNGDNEDEPSWIPASPMKMIPEHSTSNEFEWLGDIEVGPPSDYEAALGPRTSDFDVGAAASAMSSSKSFVRGLLPSQF